MKPLALPVVLSLSWLLTASSARAADVPAKPLAEKGKILFADDFNRTELGDVWKAQIATVAIADQAMLGRHTRADHGSVAGAAVPLLDGNLIFECRFRMKAMATIAFGFDDKTCKQVHAGHISRVTVEAQRITLFDDREGAMKNEIQALRKSDDPKKKAEGARLMEPHTAKVPVKLELDTWHTIVIEIVGEEMRVTLDSKPIGYLKSSGLLHPRKSDLRLIVSGSEANFDDLTIWPRLPVTAIGSGRTTGISPGDSPGRRSRAAPCCWRTSGHAGQWRRRVRASSNPPPHAPPVVRTAGLAGLTSPS